MTTAHVNNSYKVFSLIITCLTFFLALAFLLFLNNCAKRGQTRDKLINIYYS